MHCHSLSVRMCNVHLVDIIAIAFAAHELIESIQRRWTTEKKETKYAQTYTHTHREKIIRNNRKRWKKINKINHWKQTNLNCVRDYFETDIMCLGRLWPCSQPIWQFRSKDMLLMCFFPVCRQQHLWECHVNEEQFGRWLSLAALIFQIRWKKTKMKMKIEQKKPCTMHMKRNFRKNVNWCTISFAKWL